MRSEYVHGDENARYGSYRRRKRVVTTLFCWLTSSVNRGQLPFFFGRAGAHLHKIPEWRRLFSQDLICINFEEVEGPVPPAGPHLHNRGRGGTNGLDGLANRKRMTRHRSSRLGNLHIASLATPPPLCWCCSPFRLLSFVSCALLFSFDRVATSQVRSSASDWRRRRRWCTFADADVVLLFFLFFFVLFFIVDRSTTCQTSKNTVASKKKRWISSNCFRNGFEPRSWWSRWVLVPLDERLAELKRKLICREQQEKKTFGDLWWRRFVLVSIRGAAFKWAPCFLYFF